MMCFQQAAAEKVEALGRAEQEHIEETGALKEEFAKSEEMLEAKLRCAANDLVVERDLGGIAISAFWEIHIDNNQNVLFEPRLIG